MSKASSDLTTVEKCPSNDVHGRESASCKENVKNGLVNGLVHNKKHKRNKKPKHIEPGTQDSLPVGISDVNSSETTNVDQNDVDHQSHSVNNVDNTKKKSKKKKSKTKELDSNENVNEGRLDKTNFENKSEDSNTSKSDSSLSKTENEAEASCSKISASTDGSSEILQVCSGIEKLVGNVCSDTIEDQCSNKKIEFVQYESELQMPMIMKIIQKDLSEPYSIYTYRYFIHNWPKLCFLAMCEGQCVGAIVCKLDLHRKVVKRGYIAMLAVDQNYRKLRIGSTLVQMAIHEMTLGDADEVVLETEVTNKPALKLYEKLGFVRDKRLFRYYLNGVDALRLKLWLR